MKETTYLLIDADQRPLPARRDGTMLGSPHQITIRRGTSVPEYLNSIGWGDRTVVCIALDTSLSQYSQAVNQTLEYCKQEHGKGQQGYFTPGVGWAGTKLRDLGKAIDDLAVKDTHAIFLLAGIQVYYPAIC